MEKTLTHKSDIDTIVAVATPRGEGGIGIIRLSGPDSLTIGKRLFKFHQEPRKIETHKMYLGDVLNLEKDPIDRGLFLFMKSPRSYTGEDVVELHCHGGPLLLESIVLEAVSLGAKPAENGQFTRRAFMNGKLDLAQAEAVLDVISSITERGLQVSVGQLFGKLSGEIEAMKTTLTSLLTDVEASIDFPDDEMEIISHHAVLTESRRILEKVEELLSTYRQGRILREGANVVILGCPNVGKSSLINKLLGSDRAIVTAQPGTTRDTIWDFTNIDGVAVKLVDTCGIREVLEEAEQEGVRRAWEAVSTADIILLVIDVTSDNEDEERRLIDLLKKNELAKKGVETLVVFNKVDLIGKKRDSFHKGDIPTYPSIFTSALTGEGIDDLKREIGSLLLDDSGADGKTSDRVTINNARHFEALLGVKKSLVEILKSDNQNVAMGENPKNHFEPELLAVDIRGALTALKEITGEVGTDDILDAIFSRFCVGK